MAQAQRSEGEINAAITAAAGVEAQNGALATEAQNGRVNRIPLVSNALDALKRINAANAEKKAQQSEAADLAFEVMLDALVTVEPGMSEPRIIAPFLSAVANPQIEASPQDHKLFEGIAAAASRQDYSVGGESVKLDKKHQVSAGALIDALSNFHLASKEARSDKMIQARIDAARAAGQRPSIIDTSARLESGPMMDEAEIAVKSIETSLALSSLPQRQQDAVHAMLLAGVLYEIRGNANWEKMVRERGSKVVAYMSAHKNEPILKSVVRGIFNGFNGGHAAEAGSDQAAYTPEVHPERRKEVPTEYTADQLRGFGILIETANNLRTMFEETIQGDAQLRQEYTNAETNGTLHTTGIQKPIDGVNWTLRYGKHTRDGREVKHYTLIKTDKPQKEQGVWGPRYVVSETVFNLIMPVMSHRAEDGASVSATYTEGSHLTSSLEGTRRGAPNGTIYATQEADQALLDGEKLVESFVDALTVPGATN